VPDDAGARIASVSTLCELEAAVTARVRLG